MRGEGRGEGMDWRRREEVLVLKGDVRLGESMLIVIVKHQSFWWVRGGDDNVNDDK